MYDFPIEAQTCAVICIVGLILVGAIVGFLVAKFRKPKDANGEPR